MRVLTIFVRNGTDKYAGAEQELADLFHTQLPGVERDTVVVDTVLPECVIERQPRRVLIGGDNSSWEFSGFDSGLAHVGDDIWDYDLINLTTSAFRQIYADYLERFRPEVLEAMVGRSVCLGHIDCYNEAIEVRGCASQHWVRSSCVFIPPVELKILGTMVSTRDRDLLVQRHPGRTVSRRRAAFGLLPQADFGLARGTGHRTGCHVAFAHRPRRSDSSSVRAEGHGHPE